MIRSVRGGEDMHKSLKMYLQSLGIIHELTALRTPEQNGKAERENRTFIEFARTLLHSENLPIFLWAEAVNMAVYILNRTLSPTPNKTNLVRAVVRQEA